MNYFLSALRWLADSANWWGPSGIGARLLEHVILTLGVVGIAAAIALPIGIVVGHAGRGRRRRRRRLRAVDPDPRPVDDLRPDLRDRA